MERRRLLQAGTMAGLATLAGALPTTTAGARPLTSRSGGPAHRVLDDLPIAGRSDGFVLTRAVEAGRFSAVAFDLPAGAEGVHVCTRADAQWSPWTWLPAATEHAPDADGPEPLARRRHVSELLWTSAAQAFALATPAGQGPAGVRAHVLDTLADPVARGGALHTGGDDPVGRLLQPLLGGGKSPSRPPIVRPGEWGADESWRRGSPRYARPRRGIVHHTATSNGYSRREMPRMLRSILYYHTRIRGWNDIGYNFLVDRFGRVFEGRYGGLEAGVVGAHAAGHNRGSIGVAVLGDHRSTGATSHAQHAVADLLAWKYHVHEIPSDPDHRVRHGNRSYPATCGHRDVGRTSCPGGRLYDRLPAIRRRIHARS